MGFEPPPPDAIQDITRRLAEHPETWDDVRDNTRQMFDALAPQWESVIGAEHSLPLIAALERIEHAVDALDLGTGTGLGADLVQARFPDARVTGVDLAPEMIAQASAKPRPKPIDFKVADAAALPFSDASFDLVTAMNVFVFFDEAVRVLRPDGRLVFVYSRGANTPIFLPTAELAGHLTRAGATIVEEGAAGEGTFVIAARA